MLSNKKKAIHYLEPTLFGRMLSHLSLLLPGIKNAFPLWK